MASAGSFYMNRHLDLRGPDSFTHLEVAPRLEAP